MGRRSEDDLFKQLGEVYDSFRQHAEMDMTSEGPKLLYRGYLVKLFDRHGLRGSGYMRVREQLIHLGAIDILYPGGSNQTSVIAIGEKPTREQWDELRSGGHVSLRQVSQAKAGIQIAQLANRVQRLEEALANHLRANRENTG